MARAEETVAARLVARRDAVHGEANNIGSSVSGPNVATMECSGRTQRSDVVSEPSLSDSAELSAALADCPPQRIDLGQGKFRITSGMISR